MTELDFITECENRLIAPSIALENNNIVNALKDKDKNLVIELLDSEF